MYIKMVVMQQMKNLMDMLYFYNAGDPNKYATNNTHSFYQ